jgi:CheY-like chemotaxis protein
VPNTLLIIDDSLDDALLLEQLLRRKCIANPIRTVSDGLTAMDYFLGKEPYNDREQYPLPMLIFLDLGLPGRSGLSILEWLKEHPEVPRPRVVIYTQQTEYAELEKAYALGADLGLIKETLKEQLPNVLALLSEVWEFGDPPKQEVS